jgi:DNA-binding protein H-NS
MKPVAPLFSRGETMVIAVMTFEEIKFMSMDELWSLHEQVTSELACKIAAERARLGERMQRLALSGYDNSVKHGPRQCFPNMQIL